MTKILIIFTIELSKTNKPIAFSIAFKSGLYCLFVFFAHACV
ncbi:hypothetical protein RBY4I_3281 [Rhodobacterales bacterium Y4I]|nr:hypothetical protein RBY4I_3281 [Rhodobacterales bacterium Y4I]